MSTPQGPRPSTRETLLTILLLTLVAAGFLLFFISIMGMFALHALGVVGVLVFFGGMHYLLWGRSLSNEVAAEREEDEPPLDEDGSPLDGPHGPRRY